MNAYVKRPGADGSGRDYEIKITGLLALRCALRKDTQEIWLGSNLDEVGNFDDVVLFKRAFDGTVTAFLMQLKHQDLPKNIKQKEFTSNAKGASKDFYLAKYYEEYKKLKSKIDESDQNESLIIKDLKRAHKIVFVLYTNRAASMCKLLEEFLDDSWRFLNTGANGTIYKFRGLSDYGAFLDDMYLFADQAHLNDTERLMANEIKSVLGTDLFNNNHQSVFIEKFSAFLRLWAKDRYVCQPLTKNDVLNQITDLLLQDFKVGLSKELLCYTCREKLIWNELVSDKVLTVVDYSEEAVDFLKAYVGTEVKGYCTLAVRSWSDLIKDAQQLLSTHNVKVVDLRNSFTLLDVYRYLWFSNKVPLLLQVDTTDDYKNVLRILKLSGYTKRVIIVTKSTVDGVRLEKGKYFLSLAELDPERLNSVLQIPVKLQGRGPVPLTDLVDESMHNLVKSQDVIGILSGTYIIGDCYKELPEFFIERYIPKVLIKHGAFEEMSRDFFLIEDESSTFIPRESTLIVRTREEALQKLPQLRVKYPIVHWLKYKQHLEWLQSFGDTAFLKRFLYNYPSCITSVNDVHSTVNILSASPGMGKSVVLDYIAQNVPTNKWTLRLNLPEFADKSFDAIMESALNYSQCNAELSSRVFKKMKSTHNVIVLLDGFDEVSINQQSSVLRFAKDLIEEGFAMWMTTRPNMRTTLEETFGTIAMTLVPFTTDDQKSFLTKYFRPIGDRIIVQNFVNELLGAAQTNLQDWDKEFTGIPLQTKLLADVFHPDCKRSVACGVVHFNRSFDLMFLYEQFVKRKLDIMTEKFGRTAVDMRVLFEHEQKLFALRTVFPEVYLQSLNVKQEFVYNDQYKMQFMQRDGLLVVDSGTVKFVHRTFAEYLAAQWLSENLNNKDLLLLRFSDQYTFLFNLFDRILSRNNALHTAVINLKTTEALKLIATKPELVEKTDACGRNVVHLIALYGYHYKAYNETIVEPLLDVLNTIDTVHKLGCLPDKALLYTPLEYAIASWSLAIADYLSQYNSTINAEFERYKKDIYLTHCATHGYLSLFRILLMYFSASEILHVRNAAEQTIGSQFLFFSDVGAIYHKKILLLAKDIYKQPLRELYKYKFRRDETDVPDYYYDLRFASSFGTEDNVQYLLDKGSSANQQDVDKNTSLHYACLNGQLKNVEVLLRNGANINIVNVKNNSALYYTISRDYSDVAELLLKSGANPNFQNRNQFTVLQLAMTSEHKKGLVELMIKCGADPNLQNNKLNTALHYAAQMDYADILVELVEKGGEVNMINCDKETPLFFAARFGCVNAALILLEKGADVNLRNNAGRGVLNIAAEKGDCDLVLAFVARGADVDSADVDKNTPLNCALMNDNFDVAKVLWDNGADGNIRNNGGYCALHYIAGADTGLLLETLKNVDVNAITMTGDTALHLALSKNKVGNALALLGNGADVNLTNSDGNASLHLAAIMGDADVVALILSKCTDCDKPNQYGDTPLHIALKRRDIACAKFLLPNCDINKSNGEETALHYAVKKCNVDVVQFLIDNGAQIDVRNVSGKTPLHVSVMDMFYDIEGCDAIIKLLLDAGADVNVKDNFGNTALYYVPRLNSIFVNDEVRRCFCKKVIQMFVDKGADTYAAWTDLKLGLPC